MDIATPVYCTCEECTTHQQRGGKVVQLVDAASLATQARHLSTRITKNHWELENIERLNGDALFIDKWNSLPRTVRPESLQRAYKRTFGAKYSMPVDHRPDFEAINRWGGLNKTEREELEKVFAIPYLNVADLTSDTETLLAFIYTRSTHLPQEFLLLDLANANLSIDGHDDGASPAFESMTMIFGRENGDYATLDTTYTLETGEHDVQPCVGLAILIIQDQIYSFLLNIVSVLLSQCPKPSMDTKFPSKPDPVQDIDWPSMSILARRTTYQPFDTIELEYLSTMTGAHRTKALGHLLKMREDPAYFKSILLEWGQHVLTPGHRRDEFGVSEADKWAHVSTLMIQEAYFLAEKWDGITDLLLQLTESLQLCYAAYNEVEKADPYSNELAAVMHKRGAEKADILDALEAMLSTTLFTLTDTYLSIGVPGSLAMRTALKPTDYASSSTGAFKLHISNASLVKKASKGKKHAFGLFKILCVAEERDLHGPRNVTTEIQRLLDSNDDVSFKHNVSSWIQDQFAEVALIVEVISQIHMHPDLEAGNDEDEEAEIDEEDAEVEDGEDAELTDGDNEENEKKMDRLRVPLQTAQVRTTSTRSESTARFIPWILRAMS